jgi:hypothetical protein
VFGIMELGQFTIMEYEKRESTIRINVIHKHTLSSHKNASLGISSAPVLGSTGLCDSCNILDRVTFFTPEC